MQGAIKHEYGNRHGRWVVLARAENTKSGKAQWLCLCDCGKTGVVTGVDLRDNHSQSCGCLKDETTVARSTKHNGARRKFRQPEYTVWAGIVDRCENPKNVSYPNYGGRGIKVHPAWRYSFETFYAEMGDRPSDKRDIDRIDNEGDYAPGNCRWVTHKENCANRRPRRCHRLKDLVT